jgi:hypothetical protein
MGERRRAARCPLCGKPFRKGDYVRHEAWGTFGGLTETGDGGRARSLSIVLQVTTHARCVRGGTR